MSRLVLAVATASLLLAGNAQAQVDPLRYNNPLAQGNMYANNPVLRYNNPLAQGNMYANNPVLRYNNPLAQGNMYGNPAAPLTGPRFAPGTGNLRGTNFPINNGFVGNGSVGFSPFGVGVGTFPGYGYNYGPNLGYGAGFTNGFDGRLPGGFVGQGPVQGIVGSTRFNPGANNLLNGVGIGNGNRATAPRTRVPSRRR
ncbi:MAG: hypothetical protein AB7I30_05905 [Isosphaeraceae bacterium]